MVQMVGGGPVDGQGRVVSEPLPPLVRIKARGVATAEYWLTQVDGQPVYRFGGHQ